MAQQGLYKINKRPKDEQIENIAIGDFLDKIRDEMEGKFHTLKDNVEYQLAELRRQIAEEKQLQSELKEKINITEQQRDAFKQETTQKTKDLNSINSFYSNKSNNDPFAGLLNDIMARHQAFEQALQGTNYQGNVAAMNEAWRNQIHGLAQSIKAAPAAEEFAAIKDEMQHRTQELATIKQISDGKLPCSAMNDMVDQCEERHAGQAGDEMSAYKGPGIIENDEVLQNNAKWEECLSNMKDFMIANRSKLAARNEVYMKELAGRVNDLGTFKGVVNTRIPEENDPKFKRKKKEVRAMKVAEVGRKNKDLLQSVAKRHQENANAMKSTIDAKSNKDTKEFQQFTANDGGWRQEINQDTEVLIDYLV
eukprot:50172_1